MFLEQVAQNAPTWLEHCKNCQTLELNLNKSKKIDLRPISAYKHVA
jgi:hypothetical protein